MQVPTICQNYIFFEFFKINLSNLIKIDFKKFYHPNTISWRFRPFDIVSAQNYEMSGSNECEASIQVHDLKPFDEQTFPKKLQWNNFQSYINKTCEKKFNPWCLFGTFWNIDIRIIPPLLKMYFQSIFQNFHFPRFVLQKFLCPIYFGKSFRDVVPFHSVAKNYAFLLSCLISHDVINWWQLAGELTVYH